MITAEGARNQNKNTVQRILNDDYEIAVKMINGLIMSEINRKKISNDIEIDLNKKEAKIICGNVIEMLNTYYTELGYEFRTENERGLNGKRTLTVSWKE